MTDRPRVLVVGAGAAGMMAAIAAAQTLQAAGELDGGVLLLERGDRPSPERGGATSPTTATARSFCGTY